MPENPEDFYSQGAESFAEKYSIEKLPQEYIDFLDLFAEEVHGQTILDAGCGPGRDTNYFAVKGFELTGIDLADEMIKQARENQKGKYQKMDVRNLKFENNSFSGVWCNALIHLIPHEEMPKALDELKRVMKPSGVFYISFKIGEGIFTRERYGSEVKQYLVSEEKARNMLRNRNLKILKTNRARVEGTEIMNMLTKEERE